VRIASGRSTPASCSRSSSTSASAGVALAELLLDGAQLLAQDELALRAVDLALDLGLDARADLDDLELAGEDLGDAPQPQRDVGLLEQRLLLLGLQPQRAGDEVRQRAGVVDVRDGDLQLLGQVRQRLDDLAERRLHVAHERGELGRLDGDRVGQLGDLGDEVGLLARPTARPSRAGRTARGCAASRRAP
jgi:hypothetical protein